jgi:hypothetical protein
MSSWICCDMTIEAAAAGFAECGFIGNDEIPETANRLRILNEIETGYRYSETYRHKVPKISGRSFSVEEEIGAARCVHYQCSECAELSEGMQALYEQLDSVSDALIEKQVAKGDWYIEENLNNVVRVYDSKTKTEIAFPWESHFIEISQKAGR